MPTMNDNHCANLYQQRRKAKGLSEPHCTYCIMENNSCARHCPENAQISHVTCDGNHHKRRGDVRPWCAYPVAIASYNVAVGTREWRTWNAIQAPIAAMLTGITKPFLPRHSHPPPAPCEICHGCVHTAPHEE